MERKRFCVTFFLRRARTNKAGLAPILARITTNVGLNFSKLLDSLKNKDDKNS